MGDTQLNLMIMVWVLVCLVFIAGLAWLSLNAIEQNAELREG